MLYPKNWSVIEFEPFYSELNKTTIVSFISPMENFADSFSEYLSIKTIKNNQPELKNIHDFILSYKNYLNKTLAYFKSYHIYSNYSKSNLLFNNSDIIDNYPFVIVYDFTVSPPLINKKMELLLFYTDNIFIFEYGSSNDKFDKYLKTINKMVSSFKHVI